MREEFHPFALSLIVGFLIGIEREYHHKKSATAFGVRTFPFIALTGTLAGYLKILPLTVAIAGVVFTLITLSYFMSVRPRNKETDVGLTTEFAAIIVFCSGYVITVNARMGIIIGMTTLALLVSREWLHRFIRQKLKQSEINAAATLIVAVFGVAPFLPDRSVDPWHLFNPRRLVTLISIIGLIHFAGYAAIRVFGARIGLALSGYMGGFISSTAVFLQIRETLKSSSRHPKTVIASGLLAVSATLSELLGMLYLASPVLAYHLVLPLAAMILASGVLAGVLVWRDAAHVPGVENGKPMDFRTVLKLGILLSLMIAIVEIAHRNFSAAGLWVVSFTSGLFELHGASLAVSLDHARGNISDSTARFAVLMVVAASFVSKIAILFVTRRDAFAFKTSGLLALVLCCGAATLLL